MKKGFTLLEMLVVIGIIAILLGAMTFGYSKIVKSARKARTQELVSNAAAALTQLYQKNSGVWPEDIKNAATGEGLLDEKACRPLARRGYLNLDYNQDAIRNNSSAQVVLKGADRFGLVDPETAKLLSTRKDASLSMKVPTGGTVKDHILRFAVDLEGTGFVDLKNLEGASGKKVRAVAVVWAAGADGKIDFTTIGRNDDVYSWRPAQMK